MNVEATLKDADYVCSTWFERDRSHVRLEKPDGTEVFSLWDDGVTEAIDSGYLVRPRVPRPNDDDWHASAVQYARDMSLIA